MLSVFYGNSYANDLQSRSHVKKVQVKPKISTGNSVVSSQGVVTANVAKNIKILNSTQINNNHIASKQKINSHKPIPNANHAVVKNNTLQNVSFKPYKNKSAKWIELNLLYAVVGKAIEDDVVYNVSEF